MSSIYDFEVNDAKGEPYDLKQHKGHPIMIMNVANKCGLAKSCYRMAERLYLEYKDKGFTVLGFPCNQFAHQQPGTAEEAKACARETFEVTFPILQKVHVNGKDEHPLYKYMKHERKGMLNSTSIKWNFTVFLINRDGKVVARFSPNKTYAEVNKRLLRLFDDDPDNDCDDSDNAEECHDTAENETAQEGEHHENNDRVIENEEGEAHHENHHRHGGNE